MHRRVLQRFQHVLPSSGQLPTLHWPAGYRRSVHTITTTLRNSKQSTINYTAAVAGVIISGCIIYNIQHNTMAHNDSPANSHTDRTDTVSRNNSDVTRASKVSEFHDKDSTRIPHEEHTHPHIDPHSGKPRLVIIGTGWACIGMLRHLDVNAYDIHIVSPRNYVLFTPLLPSACTGTVELRSLAEPIRNVLQRFKHDYAHYYQSKAIDIDFNNKEVTCLEHDLGTTYQLKYDYLVIACGARNNNFNTEGVKQYTHYLKEIKHAKAIRLQLLHNLEHAALPCVSDAERARLLNCVVVGGGPTGVEFAAELSDFLHDDIHRQFPELEKFVKVTLIQSQDHILNTYDEKISEYAEKRFSEQQIHLVTQARVQQVKPTSVVYQDKRTKQNVEIPFGLCVWSTGIMNSKLAQLIRTKLSKQTNERSLVTDNRLRLLGVDDASVYACGDAATVDFPHLRDKAEKLFRQCDLNSDGVIDMYEFRTLCEQAVSQVPILATYFKNASAKFCEFDDNHDNVLSFAEFQTFLDAAERSSKAYPATAQVAEQQGEYLADRFNALARQAANKTELDDKPFVYTHFANLAYVGGEQSAIDFGNGRNISGFGAFWLWKSIYLSTSVSMRTRIALAVDWTKSYFFGRNTSQY